MIPLLAKAPWTGFDFVFGGSVLSASAIVYELATRNRSNKKHRVAVGIALLIAIALVMVWAAAGPDVE
jgi:multisubunit Na+/H+ antiporter MnhB subunit